MKVKPWQFVIRIFKGLMIFVWLIALIEASYISYSDNTNEALTKIHGVLVAGFQKISRRDDKPTDLKSSPHGYLDQYLFETYDRNPPPFSLILTKLVPSWDDGADNSKHYQILFHSLSTRIDSFVNSTDGELKTMSITSNIIPWSFRSIDQKRITTKGADSDSRILSIMVSDYPELLTWIKRERERQELKMKRESLADTFLILIVLGALGSLIFLTRNYIVEEKFIYSDDPELRKKVMPVSAFILQPVLGMMLALAMFIIDLLTHSVISSSSIIEIRKEPLFIFAFAAGLMSEKAYAILEIRMDAWLKKYATAEDRDPDENGPPTTDGNPDSQPPPPNEASS